MRPMRVSKGLRWTWCTMPIYSLLLEFGIALCTLVILNVALDLGELPIVPESQIRPR